jgi:hypothetical protein
MRNIGAVFAQLSANSPCRNCAVETVIQWIWLTIRTLGVHYAGGKVGPKKEHAIQMFMVCHGVSVADGTQGAMIMFGRWQLVVVTVGNWD